MDGPPVSPTGLGGSKLRDVGRTVSSEAATHLDRLKKSERTKEAVDKSVAFAAEALDDPDKIKEAARKVWDEDQKVQVIKDRTKMFLENTIESEERMEKVRTPPPDDENRDDDGRSGRGSTRVPGAARLPRSSTPPIEPPTRTDRTHPPFPDRPQARNVSSRVFSVVEKLASKGTGKVAGTFRGAATRLQGLLSTEQDNKALVENGKEVAKEVWTQLRSQAGESGALEGIQDTVQRIVTRLKDVLKTLQQQQAEQKRKEADADAIEADAYERATAAGVDHDSAIAAAAAAREMSGHVTFTAGADGKLVMTAADGQSVDVDDNDAMTKLAREGRSVWQEVRTDEQVQRLLKEEIAPGFESLIRASVEVICDLVSTLELPRVDGVYDSPLGSVCYHVDNLAFSEFSVGEDGLRVENQTGENSDHAGFGSTVSIEGIRTVMNDIRFAYCEYPKSWGMVDSDGTCSVKIEGARVGISYDIIVNTAQLMRIVNHGVELSKDEGKVNELREKVQKKWQERGQHKGAGDQTADGTAAHDVAEDEFKSPEPSPKGATPDMNYAAADAAVDKAFGGGIFGAWGGEADSGSDEEDYDDAREQQQHKRTSSISESLLGGIASLNPFGGGDSDSDSSDEESAPSQPTSPGARRQHLEAPLNDVQREKLERQRMHLRDLLGEEFVGSDPVMELRVHATSIHVGALDVDIGGTSAAWLYNMIALVLTQQLRGTIEDRINNLTVRQLGRLSGTVEAYSAGLIKVSVVKDEEEEDTEEQSMLGSWVSNGGLGKLRRDCGEWGKEWQCSHWVEGARIKRTPSSREEVIQADGTKILAPLSDLAPAKDEA